MAGRWRRASLSIRGVSAWDAADEDLRALAEQVLEDALLTLSRGPLQTFAVVEAGDVAQLHPIPPGPEEARAWLRTMPAGVERAVLAHAGEVEVHGEVFDVVWVDAHARGARASARLGQRYRYIAGHEPERIGTVFDAGDAPALLP